MPVLHKFEKEFCVDHRQRLLSITFDDGYWLGPLGGICLGLFHYLVDGEGLEGLAFDGQW
jgi:hypothetical protein